MKICPNCGAENTDTASFCKECGANLSQKQKRFCMFCGAEMGDDDVFCPNCGRKVSGDDQADSGYNNYDDEYRTGSGAGNYDDAYQESADNDSGECRTDSGGSDYDSGYGRESRLDYSEGEGGHGGRSPGLVIGTVVAAALAAVIVVAALAWNGIINLPFGTHSGDTSEQTAAAVSSGSEEPDDESSVSGSSEVSSDSESGSDTGNESQDSSGGKNLLMPDESDTSGSNAQQNANTQQNASAQQDVSDNNENNADTEQDTQSVTSYSFYGGHAATDGQIFPDSSTRRLSDSEVRALDQYSMQDAINEIYARKGAIFQKTPELNTYYGQTSWYHGTTSISNITLNSVENDNVNLISKYRTIGEADLKARLNQIKGGN